MRDLIPRKMSVAVDDNPAYATDTLTSDTTAITDGKVVVLGAITYRFKDTPAQANDIQNNVDPDVALANLVAAINGTGTEGVEYFAGTEASPVASAAAVAAHATVVTALTAGFAGNSIVATTDEAHLAWGGSGTLAGGGSTIGTSDPIGKGGGRTNRFVTVCPQQAGTPTYTLAIMSSDGVALYTSGNLNENATTITALEYVLDPTDYLKITMSTKISEALPVVVYIR